MLRFQLMQYRIITYHNRLHITVQSEWVLLLIKYPNEYKIWEYVKTCWYIFSKYKLVQFFKLIGTGPVKRLSSTLTFSSNPESLIFLQASGKCHKRFSQFKSFQLAWGPSPVSYKNVTHPMAFAISWSSGITVIESRI